MQKDIGQFYTKPILILIGILVLTYFVQYVVQDPRDFLVYHHGARGVFEGTRPVYGENSGVGSPMIYRYPPLFLLVFGYVMLFLPAALNPLRTSLLQVSPRLEEVARSLGKRPLTVMATITIPLLWPSLIAASALVFLLTMKELPVTLILSPPGFTTLATSIWSAASEAFFARAAVASLLLILATAFPLIWLLRKGDQ